MPIDKRPRSGRNPKLLDQDPGNGKAAPDDSDGDDTPAGETLPTTGAEGTEPSFFIVGVGASAGGFEALTALLAKAQLDRMAFVIVQHLAPKHESLLPALLSRISNVEVVAATDGTKVEAHHIYVIPPNADLAILQGVLHVMTPQRIRRRMGRICPSTTSSARSPPTRGRGR